MNTVLVWLLIMTLIALVFTVTVALLVRRAVRRVRRTVRARMVAARRNAPVFAASRPVDRRTRQWWAAPLRIPADLRTEFALGPVLSARAWQPGPTGTVARLRRDLHRDVIATSRILREARKAGRPVQGLERSVASLARHERELQLDLRVIAAEPDRVARNQLLSTHAARAGLIHRTCAQVRNAVLDEGSTSNEPALHQIVEDIDEAVTAVGLQARAYRDLSRR
jgi:hypothetical protein